MWLVLPPVDVVSTTSQVLPLRVATKLPVSGSEPGCVMV
jgi:hypothetical protein